MSSQSRFGTTPGLPPLAESRHELRMMAAADRLVAVANEQERALIVSELAREHKLTRGRAQRFADRFGIGKVERAWSPPAANSGLHIVQVRHSNGDDPRVRCLAPPDQAGEALKPVTASVARTSMAGVDTPWSSRRGV